MPEVNVLPTVSNIETLAQLIRAAVEIAENLAVADQQTRRELLEGLAVAQFNALRLAENNNAALESELRILQ